MGGGYSGVLASETLDADGESAVRAVAFAVARAGSGGIAEKLQDVLILATCVQAVGAGAGAGPVEPLDSPNELVVLVHTAKRLYDDEDDSPG